MENNLQISSSEQFYLSKKESVNNTLQLPNKSFLQKSYSFQKLSEIKKDANFVFLIGGWITQTSALMQIKNPIDNLIKQDIVNMFGGYWSNLGLEDLIKAFELERFGIFKEKTEHYQLFDSNYISQILKKYQNWKREKKIEFNIINQNNQQVKELTEKEKSEIMTKAINDKYNHFCTTKQILEPFTHIFTELVNRGLIKTPSTENPNLFYYYDKKLKEAKEEIEIELKSQKHTDNLKRKEVKLILESIASNQLNKSLKAKIEVRAKKTILIEFFNKQIMLNKIKIF